MEKIALGSDHAGFELKQLIKTYLDAMSLGWEDLGTDSTESCDYPDYARAVADAVSAGRFKRGILCCGSGIGVSIVANKVRGIRAALCHDEESASLSRQHNDANILCLSGRTIKGPECQKILKAWFEAEFQGGRHARRVEKIEKNRKGESSWSDKVKSSAVTGTSA